MIKDGSPVGLGAFGAGDEGVESLGEDDDDDDDFGGGDEGVGAFGRDDGDDDTGFKFGGGRGYGVVAERLRGTQIACAELKKKRVNETINNLDFIFEKLKGNVCQEHEKRM